MTITEVFVDHFLPMLQEDSHNPKGGSATDVLTITDIAKNYKQFVSAKNNLHLGHTVNVRTSIYQVTASNYVDFHQQGAKGPGPQSVLHNLALWHSARTIEYEAFSQTLTIDQTVSYDKAKAGKTTLTFTDLASQLTVRTRTANNTVVMVSGVGVYKLDKYSYQTELPTLTGPNAPEC